jgi:hypothetical protein
MPVACLEQVAMDPGPRRVKPYAPEFREISRHVASQYLFVQREHRVMEAPRILPRWLKVYRKSTDVLRARGDVVRAA